MDFGFPRSPLYIFAEELTSTEQSKFLIDADRDLRSIGVLLLLPVHGGNPCISGEACPILAYGQYNWYDSLAPEFDTYETIKSIALNRTQSASSQ